MKTFWKRCALLLLPLLIACGDDDDPAGLSNEEVAGVYVLATVNDEPLPFVLLEGPDYLLELINAEITLGLNGTFSDEGTVRETDAANVSTDTETVGGTYTTTSNSVRLRYSNGDLVTGAFDDDVLTFSDGGITFVFRR
jgi:hypothetical protein